MGTIEKLNPNQTYLYMPSLDHHTIKDFVELQADESTLGDSLD